MSWEDLLRGGNTNVPPTSDNTPQPASVSYPQAVGPDGQEFVQIPVQDFEILKRGNLQDRAFQQKSQVLSISEDYLKKGEAELNQKLAALDAKLKQAESLTDPKNIEKIMAERLAPIHAQSDLLMKQQVDSMIDKQIVDFKVKFAPIFTGKKAEDDAIIDRICLNAAIKPDGTQRAEPMTLDKSFFDLYGEQYYQGYNANQKPSPRGDWGTEDSSSTGSPKVRLATEADADAEFERILREKRGLA